MLSSNPQTFWISLLFFYQCPFIVPASDSGAHVAFCCHVSLVSSSLCLLLMISFSFITLTLLKNNFIYFVDCVTVLVCMSFSQSQTKAMEFVEEYHRGKGPASLYDIGSHVIATLLISSDVVFDHLGKCYLSVAP